MPRLPTQKRKPPARKTRHNTSFVLAAEDQVFIRKEVADGRFTNASAVVRAALASYREQTERERAWDAAVRAGLESPLDARPAREVAAEIRARHFG